MERTKTAGLIAYTFNAIAKNANFKSTDETTDDEDEELERVKTKSGPDEGKQGSSDKSPLRPDFHFNIQIHLPANGTEETYLNIFAALRRTFS